MSDNDFQDFERQLAENRSGKFEMQIHKKIL